MGMMTGQESTTSSQEPPTVEVRPNNEKSNNDRRSEQDRRYAEQWNFRYFIFLVLVELIVLGYLSGWMVYVMNEGMADIWPSDIVLLSAFIVVAVMVATLAISIWQQRKRIIEESSIQKQKKVNRNDDLILNANNRDNNQNRNSIDPTSWWCSLRIIQVALPLVCGMIALTYFFCYPPLDAGSTGMWLAGFLPWTILACLGCLPCCCYNECLYQSPPRDCGMIIATTRSGDIIMNDVESCLDDEDD